MQDHLHSAYITDLGLSTSSDCYVELAKECMDQDQNKRPTADVIGSIISYWLYAMRKDNNNEIKKHFLDADKIKLNVESPKHPDHIYTSKLINTQEITSKLDLHEIPFYMPLYEHELDWTFSTEFDKFISYVVKDGL